MTARAPDPDLCARLRRGAERGAARAAALPGVHSVLLFGSVACGRADEWSDVDVALVADERCEEAVEAFREEIPDAEVQLVWMTPGNGYAGAGKTGGLGREAVRLGDVLEDDGRLAEVWEMTRYTRTANEEEVADRQKTTFTFVEAAVRTWRAYRDDPGRGNLRALGRTTADAGEFLMKNGLGYRGMFAARTHDILELVEKMRPQEGEVVPTLFEEEHGGEFARWAELHKDSLDGKTSTDRLAVYERTEVPDEEDQRRRIPVILETALEEHEKLCGHPALSGLAAACAGKLEDIRRATYGLRNDPDPAIAAAAREWAGVLEQAADRDLPFTLDGRAPESPALDPARHDSRERGLRLVEDAPRRSELELVRRWLEGGEQREERCRVSYPPDAGAARLEAMKRAWTSGRVTPNHLATPAEREATKRVLAGALPGQDAERPGPPPGGATAAASPPVRPPGRGGGRRR